MSIFALSKPLKDKSPYLWADRLELLCLDAPDKNASVNDLAMNSQNHEDVSCDSDYENDNDDPEIEDNLDDKLQLLALDGFNLCVARSYFYGDYYPFDVSNERESISLKLNLNACQKNYLALLIYSNTGCLDQEPNGFRSEFEGMAFYALKGSLAPEAGAWLIGTVNAADDRYLRPENGSTIAKLKAVAEKLGREPKQYGLDGISPNSTGDRGLDLFAIVPMPDSGIMPEEFFVFAQCSTAKATETVAGKQFDLGDTNLSDYIELDRLYDHHLYFSACFRENSGKISRIAFQRRGAARLMDRLRILHFIDRWVQRNVGVNQSLVLQDQMNQLIQRIL